MWVARCGGPTPSAAGGVKGKTRSGFSESGPNPGKKKVNTAMRFAADVPCELSVINKHLILNNKQLIN